MHWFDDSFNLGKYYYFSFANNLKTKFMKI